MSRKGSLLNMLVNLIGETNVEALYADTGNFLTDEIYTPKTIRCFEQDIKTFLKEEHAFENGHCTFHSYMKEQMVDFIVCVARLQEEYHYDLVRIHKQLALIQDDLYNILNHYVYYLRYAKEYSDGFVIHSDDEWFQQYSKYLDDDYIKTCNCPALCIHDKFHDLLNMRGMYERNNDITSRYNELKCFEDEIEYNGNKYLFVVPKTPADIIFEAKEMHNCIASRLHQYAKGEWVYVFMRDAADAEKPLVDIIIRRDGGVIVWAITNYHKDVVDDNKDVVDIYWNRHKDFFKEGAK